jgi:hypothetical protein
MRTKRWFVILLVTFLFVSSTSCGFGGGSEELIETAAEALHDWAIVRDVPYEIIDSKVISSSDSNSVVEILAVTEDFIYRTGDLRPRLAKVTVLLKKYGDEWRADKPISVDDVFEAELFSADERSANECMSVLIRANDTYPCLRFENQSAFRIKGTPSVWLGRCGTGIPPEVKVAEGESFDLVLSKTWYEDADCGDWKNRVYIELMTKKGPSGVIFYGSVAE